MRENRGEGLLPEVRAGADVVEAELVAEGEEGVPVDSFPFQIFEAFGERDVLAEGREVAVEQGVFETLA